MDLRGLGAIIDLGRGENWSPDRLGGEIARRASLLRARNVGPGQRVIVAHGGTAEFFADLFAVWRVGACAACVHPELTEAQLDNIAAFVEPAAILVARGETRARRSIPTIWLGEGEGAAAFGASAAEVFASDDPALILFTSGTTGAPKGVVHSHRSLEARVGLNRTHIGDDAIARALCVLPTHFGHGLIGNCLTPLSAGHDLFLYPTHSVAEISRVGSLIDEHAITFMSSVPALWNVALKASRRPGAPALRQIHVGSAPLSARLWRSIIDWCGTDNVVNMYGITETANWIAGASARNFALEDGLVGRMWGGRAAVRREDGAIVPVGEGELMIDSPSRMQGYFRRDDLTASVLCDTWYCTGDTGRIDQAGVIRLSGRRSEEINRAGVKIQPTEIERVLEAHPEIAEACCFALPDAVSGEIAAVAIVPAGGSNLDVAAVQSWCAGRLHRELTPERWYILSSLPRSDRGKVLRREVRERCLKGGS